MEITNIAWMYRTGQAKGREIPISSITLNSDFTFTKFNFFSDFNVDYKSLSLQQLATISRVYGSEINIHISFHLFDKMLHFPARFRRVEKLIAISNSSSPARFLQLHDEVLRRILWFLPVEDAVRTSILSKRWKTYMDVNHRS
ncbi:hypothetical protein ACJIZ3_023420 [Penstemon smallii]|uniref:F-box domain-containing protein n=1 Tax=Penstemon smallii TaxID=265156 RepID=A0ABD3TP23_9LAMI